MRQICLAIFILVVSFKVVAQQEIDSSNLYKELELNKSTSEYTLFPVGKKGFVLGYVTDIKYGWHPYQDFVFQKFDVNFKEDYKVNFKIEYLSSFINSKIDGDFIYLLFVINQNRVIDPLYPNDYFEDYLIIRFNYLTKDIKTFHNQTKQIFHLKRMEIIDKQIVLAGKTGKMGDGMFTKDHYIPMIIKVDMDSLIKKEYIIEPAIKGSNEILDFDFNEITGNIDCIVKNKSKKKINIAVSSANKEKLSDELEIKLPEDIEVFNSCIKNIGGGIRLIVGNYGPIRESYIYFKDKNYSERDHEKFNAEEANYTKGVYISLTNKDVVLSKLVPWSDFTFFKKDKDIEKKLDRTNNVKRGEIAYTTNLLFHEPFINGKDEIVFMCEMYYPKFEYRTVRKIDENNNNKEYYASIKTFVGYYFSGMLVFAISKTGELVWDDLVKVSDVNTRYLLPQFKIKEITKGEGNRVIMINEGSELKLLSVSDEGVLLDNYKIDINKYLLQDYTIKFHYAKTNKVDYWYDRYFITSCGLKLKSRSDKEEKGVFYIFKGKFPDTIFK